MRKVLSALGNIAVTLVVIFSIVLTVLVIIGARDEYNAPTLFGYSILNVRTDSMVGENGFDVGTLIIVRRISEDEVEDTVKVGDVITFQRWEGDEAYLETHRVAGISVELVNSNPECTILMNEVKDGVWHHGGLAFYVTQGDNTPGPDVISGGNFDYATRKSIIGVWTGKKIDHLGGIMEFLRSPTGFMICIVIPVALFFIYELYVFIMTLTRKQKEKALAEVADKEAELKQKAIAEFLAQQQKDGGSAVDADTSPAEPAASDAPPAAQESPAADAKPEAPAPAAQETPVAQETPADDAATPEISDAEKDRIIREYLAKQAQENKEE